MATPIDSHLGSSLGRTPIDKAIHRPSLVNGFFSPPPTQSRDIRCKMEESRATMNLIEEPSEVKEDQVNEEGADLFTTPQKSI